MMATGIVRPFGRRLEDMLNAVFPWPSPTLDAFCRLWDLVIPTTDMLCLYVFYAVLGYGFGRLVGMIAYPWHPSDDGEHATLEPHTARRRHRRQLGGLAIAILVMLGLYEMLLWAAGTERSWDHEAESAKLLLIAGLLLSLAIWQFARRRIITQLVEHRRRLGGLCGAILVVGLAVQYRYHFNVPHYWSAYSKPMPVATPQAWPKTMESLSWVLSAQYPERSTVLLLVEPDVAETAYYVQRFRSALAPSHTLIIDRPTASGAAEPSAAAGSDLDRQRWDAAHPEWFAAAVARHPEAGVVVSMVGFPRDHRDSSFCKRLAQPGSPLLILADLRGLYPERWLSADDHVALVLTAKPGVRVHPSGPATPLAVDILYRLEPAPTRATRPGDPRP